MNVKEVSCTLMRYQEFPDLLFGTADNELGYFDATHFIEKRGDIKTHNVPTFKAAFTHYISAAVQLYNIPSEDIVIMNKSGHILIEESLALLFASYIDVTFAMYMQERMSELLINGYVLSDHLLISMAKQRLNLTEIPSESVDG